MTPLVKLIARPTDVQITIPYHMAVHLRALLGKVQQGTMKRSTTLPLYEALGNEGIPQGEDLYDNEFRQLKEWQEDPS